MWMTDEFYHNVYQAPISWCHPEYCKALGYTGNMDLTGIGVSLESSTLLIRFFTHLLPFVHEGLTLMCFYAGLLSVLYRGLSRHNVFDRLHLLVPPSPCGSR